MQNFSYENEFDLHAHKHMDGFLFHNNGFVLTQGNLRATIKLCKKDCILNRINTCH